MSNDWLPSAPRAEEVLSPLEYAELYWMARVGEDLAGQQTKKALKLKAYVKRLKLAVQQRVENEVADARSQGWTWKSPEDELEMQLRELQGLIDDVSSVASAEDGVWRYKKVWEPKLRFIQEDLERGVPEDDIAEKYDIYDAVGEAIQYQESMKLLRQIDQEVKQTENILTQTQAENESESIRLLSFFDSLQGRIDNAMKLEARASKLSLQAKDCEAALQCVRSGVSGLKACLNNSPGLSDFSLLKGASEPSIPFWAEAEELAKRLSQQAEEGRKDFEMIQKSNQEATEFLNSQLRAYEEAQRSCGLLSGTLQDLQQALLEHKDEPPLPSIVKSKQELLCETRMSLQRCSFKARQIETFEMEEQLKHSQTETDLATSLDLARRIEDVDPVLVEEKQQLLNSLTEKRMEQERREDMYREAQGHVSMYDYYLLCVFGLFVVLVQIYVVWIQGGATPCEYLPFFLWSLFRCDFEEVRHLGRGAYGEVLLMRQSSTGLLCAVKKLGKTSMTAGEEAEHLAEVKALQALKHPCILRYYGSMELDESLSLVMEFADAGDVQHLLKACLGQQRSVKPQGSRQLLYLIVFWVACPCKQIQAASLRRDRVDYNCASLDCGEHFLRWKLHKSITKGVWEHFETKVLSPLGVAVVALFQELVARRAAACSVPEWHVLSTGRSRRCSFLPLLALTPSWLANMSRASMRPQSRINWPYKAGAGIDALAGVKQGRCRHGSQPSMLEGRHMATNKISFCQWKLLGNVAGDIHPILIMAA
eukprot:Skav204976  [mRNA]  locus=scaffold1180:194345:204866:- [translate_table: standard]